ncbi:SCP-like protein, partial [Ostertagia ostertagi]
MTSAPQFTRDPTSPSVLDSSTNGQDRIDRNRRQLSSSTAASSGHESSSSSEASTTTAETTPPASPDNKICPSNSGMTDKLRVRSHEAHNFRRSRLAQGMVKNKMGRTLPQATNMYKLVYNCTLEKSAMDSANRCSTIQDPNLPSGVGENNYFFSKDGISSEVEALIYAVKYWWSSIRKYGGMGRHVTYTLYNELTPTKYFTQMAWATTQHFGCAVVSCGNYWSTVCHYSPK